MTTAGVTRPARRLFVLIVTVIMVTSVLGPAIGVAAAASEDEPNDSRDAAVAISSGTQITGEVASDDDEDWFKISVERGETLEIPVSLASDASGTPYVYLYNGEGESVDGKYLKKGETVTFDDTVEADGTYYLQVYYDTGSYSFTATTTRTDSFEPNEDRADAIPIQEGVSQNGEISVHNDEDWFKFNATRGETLEIPVSLASDASGTPYVYLYNEEEESVDGGYLKKGETVTFGDTVEADETYYIRVYYDTGSYSLTATTTRTDSFEPNEGRSTATSTYYNPFQPTEAQVSTGDEDWFAVEAEAGEEIRVEGTSESGDAFVYINDESTNLNGTYLRTDGGTVTHTVSADGTYYIRIYFDKTQYDVTLSVGGDPVGLPNDEFERSNPPVGNQDRANATDIEPGVYTELGMVDDDRDVFAVDLEAGERMSAAIDFTHAENDLQLAIIDDSDTTLEQADSSTDREQLGFTAPSAGTYYLVVSGQAGAEAKYDLDLDVLRTVNVTVGPGATTLPPENTTTVTVTAANVGAGLSTANLTLLSSNTSVVTIQSISAAGSGSVTSSVASDGGSATVNVTNLNAQATGQVPLVEVTLASRANGTATLSGSATVTSATGAEYPIGTVQGTTVTVEPPTTVPSIVDTYDGDSSGTIDNRELLAALADYPDQVSPTDLLDLLAVYDPGG